MPRVMAGAVELFYESLGEGTPMVLQPTTWTPADLSNDLVHLLDALGIEKAIVGGSSLGGAVAAQFAVDRPGGTRVAGI